MNYKALETCKWEDVLRDIRKFDEDEYWGDPTPKWTRALADELDTNIYNPEVVDTAKNWVISEMESRIKTLYERLEGDE